MSVPENNQGSGLLNRNKVTDVESNFIKGLQEVEKETINATLATQFPEWDLKPPATLIKRRSSKFL